MNRLWLAREGYKELKPALDAHLDELVSDRAESWLRDAVCPVVEELLHSRSFKLAARWSLDHLSKRVNTDERLKVEEVDSALVACAKALADITVSASGEEFASPQGAFSRVAVTPGDRFAVKWIAGRPWFDLVRADEFFDSSLDLNFRQSTSEHTDLSVRDSVTQLTAAYRQQGDLRIPLGDYVLRSMFTRIDFWKSILDRIWNNLFVQPSGDGQLTYAARNRLFEAKCKLDQAVDELTKMCRSGDAPRRREAAVTLVQVYTAYSPVPDLDWLGFPLGWGTADRGFIRTRVRRQGEILKVEPIGNGRGKIVERQPALLCDREAIKHIAEGLLDVAPLYDLPEDPDDLIEWAKDRARLTMVDRSPRAVFWEGVPAAVGDWDQHPLEWNLLWVLAENPGQAVDQQMLMTPNTHPMKSRRNRLSKLLNDFLDLDNRIENDRGHGYRLQLNRDEILRLHDTGGRLVFEGHGRGAIV